MTERFDFMAEHRIDDIRNIYVDYEGNICVEYQDWSDFGGGVTREIEVPLEDMERIIELARDRRRIYEDYERNRDRR